MSAEIKIREILPYLFERFHPLPGNIGNGVEGGFVISGGDVDEPEDGEEDEEGELSESDTGEAFRPLSCLRYL